MVYVYYNFIHQLDLNKAGKNVNILSGVQMNTIASLLALIKIVTVN